MPKNTPNVDKIPYGYCHCGCGQLAPIAKESYRKKGHVKGRPCRFVAGHQFRRGTLEERFWQKVIRRGPDECWDWSGNKSVDGYGRIQTGKPYMKGAHRVSYELHYGTIPDGMHVLHRCDNPPCTNPAHLFLGDDAANVRDKMDKGRANMPTGENHHSARFTHEQVRQIRALYETGNYTKAELARMFRCNKAGMRRIVLGLSYQDA